MPLLVKPTYDIGHTGVKANFTTREEWLPTKQPLKKNNLQQNPNAKFQIPIMLSGFGI
jgi:hypothetical protein